MEENDNPVESADSEIVPALKPRQLRHREILSRLVYYSQSVEQIARELDFSAQHINRIIASPLFQAELQKELTVKRRMERDAVIQQVADEGSKKLLEAVTTGKLTYTMDGGKIMEKVIDGREIIAIAQDALDRTGHKPTAITVDAHVDLGSLIIQATKEAEDAEKEDLHAEEKVEIIDVTPEGASNGTEAS